MMNADGGSFSSMRTLLPWPGTDDGGGAVARSPLPRSAPNWQVPASPQGTAVPETVAGRSVVMDFGWEVKRSVRWRTANARGLAPGRRHIPSLPLAREVSRLPVTLPTDIRAEKWEFGSGSLVGSSGHFGTPDSRPQC